MESSATGMKPAKSRSGEAEGKESVLWKALLQV